jgi:GNAT superfamily N-acetyltransferase
MSGGSGSINGANWPNCPTVTCMTSGFPGAISPLRPKSRFGGLNQQPGRRRLLRGTPAIVFSGKTGALAMFALRLNDLRQHSDILRSRTGKSVTVRFVEPRDAEALQGYFRSLSVRSRYNRFLGAISELPKTELDHFVHVGESDRFSVIATMMVDGFETIVGEARYAFDVVTSSFEFGLSIDDHWQGHGIGSALLKNLECRAAAFGASRLFGDTLRSNDVMISLARKSGFAFSNSPGDWKLVRFEKHIDAAPQEIPCASWRLAAQQIAHQAAV